MLAVPTAAGVVAACGAAAVDASDYDQSCTTASDCVFVEELETDGTVCRDSCTQALVNKREQARFEKDRAEALGSCTERRIPFCDGSPAIAACVRGRCVVAPIDDAGSTTGPLLGGDAGDGGS